MSSPEETTKKSLQALSLAALGIVFGDIGTSPLYAFQQVFSNGIHSVPVSESNIYGVLSLFFWSLMMVVSLKYVFFMMRADNHGEGGIMALMALAMGHLPEGSPKRRTLLVLGLIGASFFYGDGVITPAISVLSAVEGLELISPSLKDFVIPVALGILLALFWSQRRGTGTIGLFFGPVMLIWFVAIGLLGILNILQHPGVLAALNPLHAIEFLAIHGPLSFFALGAVVLCLTGAEALYADMGHFGPLPIRIVWTGLVLPALVLNYFGQGALLLDQADALSNLFYMMAPAVLHPALIILATVATVIASQAVISGAFSMTRQAWQLGFLPHMRITQTAADALGQIYVPTVNTLLAICVVAVILLFKSSSALGSAYGIAVTGTMLITDFLAIVAVINIWRWRTWQSIMGASTFIVIDSVYFASNTLKLFDGGWLPLALSLAMIIIMTTWHRGRVTLFERVQKEAVPITEYIASQVTDTTPRIKGTGIYLLNNPKLTPKGLRATMEHFGVIHEQVGLLYFKYALTPYVAPEDRLNVTLCDKGFLQLQLNCGFMERISIPDELKAHWPQIVTKKPDPASFFITQWIVGISPEPGMMHWRRNLFRMMFRNAQQPLEFLSLPIADTMIISRRIDL